MPFWLIPFDLLFAAPVLAFTSPRTLQNMAVGAANGGLIPWQSRMATPIGSFQFVLGREVAVDFYGYASPFDVFLPTPGVGTNNVTQVAMRSVKVEFPIVEYRPFRSFSMDQSAGVVIQLYGGWDKPNHATVIAPAGAPMPELRTIWLVGLRSVFDWRNYF